MGWHSRVIGQARHNKRRKNNDEQTTRVIKTRNIAWYGWVPDLPETTATDVRRDTEGAT